MNALMLDLETLGVRPGCALRSIGAVLFDPLSGQTGDNFYENVDRPSCEAAGLHVDSATEKWWSEQSQAAQLALTIDPLPLQQALLGFFRWANDRGAEKVWAHGANFDPPIIEAAAFAVKLRAPWKFWNVRDTRTLYDIADFDVRSMNRDARVHHNALDDCYFQIACVSAAMRKLRGDLPKPTRTFDETLTTPELFG